MSTPGANLPPRPWQPRFSLFTLLLVMAMVGVASGAGYYLMEALRDGRLNSRPVFIMFTLAAPTVVVVIVLSLIHI